MLAVPNSGESQAFARLILEAHHRPDFAGASTFRRGTLWAMNQRRQRFCARTVSVPFQKRAAIRSSPIVFSYSRYSRNGREPGAPEIVAFRMSPFTGAAGFCPAQRLFQTRRTMKSEPCHGKSSQAPLPDDKGAGHSIRFYGT
jgi:hypothetical protein